MAEAGLLPSRFPSQDLLEALPLAVYVCDSPSGEIRRFNRAAEALWGGAPAPGTQLCGAMRLFLPDGTPLPVEDCPMAFAVREGRSYADQYVLMQRTDGRRFIANVNIAPIHDAHGRLLGAINAFQDVTARRRSEMLVDAQRTLLQEIAAGAPMTGILVNAALAAERYALGGAHALVFLVEDGALRLGASSRLPDEVLDSLQLVRELPRELPVEGRLRLAHAEPVLGCQGPRAFIALYEPAAREAPGFSYEGLELIAQTVALALQRQELVQAERATADRFRLLLEGLPAAAYTCDAQGCITYFNRHAAQLWGREPRLNDLADRYCGALRLYLPDGTPVAHDECWMARALKEGVRYDGREITVERPDGARRTALAYALPFRGDDGAITGAVNVLVDISERKAAESTLKASEQRLRAIVETTPECVKLVAADGTLLQMNASGLAMVGAAGPQEAVGRSVYDLIAPADRAAFIAFNERICRGERGTLEFDVIGLDGRRRHMETHAAPLADADGKLVQLAITLVVTERKRTQAEREKFAAQLAESDRRKDEFIATLSHELRNPLAPLKTSLDLLGGAAGQDPATVAKLQQIMQRQADHLVRLVDDLLETSRITRGTFELRKERIAVESVVRQALETSRPAIEAGGHELAVALPPEPLWVDGDSVRLVQILSNLLNNAAKYTERQGRIALHARREGAQAVIVVQDNGTGIAPEMAPHLFEMFTRDYAGQGDKGGLGVGLALARRLAEMHGGTIEARSAGRGHGSEFELRLPLASRGASTSAARQAERAALSAPGRRVLVVDDNHDAAETLALLLRAAGAEVRVAHDGVKALTMLDSYAPTAVLLDIGMPGMDGYEVARAIRSAHPRPLVLVALTGWGQDHDREAALAAGFDYHLVKPADIDELIPILDGVQPRGIAGRPSAVGQSLS